MENITCAKELLELKNKYEQEKTKFADQKEILMEKKKEIYNRIIENIKSEMDMSPNNERLQKYLEETSITKFEFLYRSLIYMPGNNQNGSLSFQDLILLDPDVKNIGLKNNITSGSELFKIICQYEYYHISNPFLEDEKVIEIMKKAKKLLYLDEIFKNIDNVLKYQGTYTVYSYVKSFIKEALKEETLQDNNKIIYKDYTQKIEIVLNNLSNIASYLLDIREQTPYSRLALCNQGLSRVARKVPGTGITFEQKVFANGIAFGTTLEKLKNGNYDDAKRLIFIPHQKILK